MNLTKVKNQRIRTRIKGSRTGVEWSSPKNTSVELFLLSDIGKTKDIFAVEIMKIP
jgi:hypothetical protein